MNFKNAISYLHCGLTVSRKKWVNKQICLFNYNDIQNALKCGYGEYLYEPWICTSIGSIEYTDGRQYVKFGWVAVTDDMLAEDWYVISGTNLNFNVAKRLLDNGEKITRDDWTDTYLIHKNHHEARLLPEPCNIKESNYLKVDVSNRKAVVWLPPDNETESTGWSICL